MAFPLSYQEDVLEEQKMHSESIRFESPAHIMLHEIELEAQSPISLPPSSSPESPPKPTRTILFPEWFLYVLFGISLCGMISGAYAIEEKLLSVGLVVIVECVSLLVLSLSLLIRGKQFSRFQWKRTMIMFLILAIHGTVWFGLVESSISLSKIRPVMIIFSVIWSPWFVFSFMKLAL